MKRLLLLSLSILLLSGCGPIPFYRTGADIHLISVSAGTDSGGSRFLSFSSSDGDSLSRSITTYPLADDTYFKEDRKAANRGNLVCRLTPESFVLDIDAVALYNRSWGGGYDSTEIYSEVKQPNGSSIPQHYDLAYADDFIRGFRVFRSQFEGIAVDFLPFAGYHTTNDGFYVRSITGVALPQEYVDAGVNFGEMPASYDLPAGLACYPFDDLQPFETNDGFLSYLTFGADVGENGIQNPLGEVGNWDLPTGSTTGNAVSLFFKIGSPIDLSPYANPEIVFNWDLENLIEIWDHGTPANLSDDIITYSLSNPFPVSLSVRENVNRNNSSASDITAPSEVISPAIAGANTWNTIQWINPVDRDFKEVVVVRKAGSAPADRRDGEEVYRSYIPNYIDVSGGSGTDYYYRVFTLDYSGNYSSGVVLHQIQH